MKVEEIFDGVYRIKGQIATLNLVPGKSVYGEELIKVGKMEYRVWNPYRSKTAAAILNGLKNFPIKNGTKVLYLGAAAGTTPSHFSDIVRENGIIYAVEFSPRIFREFLEMAKDRKNLVPILADARKTESYAWVEAVEVIYCDIAQSDEVDIAIRNAREFLKRNGRLMIAIKSRSIDVTKEPSEIYKAECDKLKKAGFKVLELVNLEPYEKDHAMVIART